MPEIIQRLLDLSQPPTWRTLLTEFLGTLAVFALPVIFAFWAVAFGWGSQP